MLFRSWGRRADTAEGLNDSTAFSPSLPKPLLGGAHCERLGVRKSFVLEAEHLDPSLHYTFMSHVHNVACWWGIGSVDSWEHENLGTLLSSESHLTQAGGAGLGAV